jgi:hypothetical protein
MNWPFKYINGVQTPESLALESKPVEKPLSDYNVALNEIKGVSPGDEEGLF